MECRHNKLAVGERCPACGRGRLYRLPPGIELRLDGNALLAAVRYELEKLRCSACGQIFTAPLPIEAGPEKYTARARAVLALARYYLDLPLYRLESYQALVGVPVPDATQWDQIEHVGNGTYPIFKHFAQRLRQLHGTARHGHRAPGRMLNRHDQAALPKYRKADETQLHSLNTGRSYRPATDWVWSEAPALISAEWFEKAQLQLQRNAEVARKLYQPSSHRYLLRTLVKCGECGLGCVCLRRPGVCPMAEYLY